MTTTSISMTGAAAAATAATAAATGDTALDVVTQAEAGDVIAAAFSRVAVT